MSLFFGIPIFFTNKVNEVESHDMQDSDETLRRTSQKTEKFEALKDDLEWVKKLFEILASLS